MTRYVAQSKYLEQLKQNDELCSQAFPKGSFMMFFTGKPLTDLDNGKLSIKWSQYQGLQIVMFCGISEFRSCPAYASQPLANDNGIFFQM